MKFTPNLGAEKHGQRTTVTLAIVWIAAMAVASTPGWVRGATAFVNTSTGHVTKKSSGGGSNAGLK